jgi:hypothetical protein
MNAYRLRKLWQSRKYTSTAENGDFLAKVRGEEDFFFKIQESSCSGNTPS